jgi:hypothetical protein
MSDYSALEEILCAEEVIKVQTAKGEAEISVRGLNLTDISILLEKHFQPIADAFEKIQSDSEDFSSARDVAANLLREAPRLVTEVIALGAGGMPHHLVERLTIDKQVEAVEKILKLSVSEDGGLGKLMESIINMMAAFNKTEAPSP